MSNNLSLVLVGPIKRPESVIASANIKKRKENNKSFPKKMPKNLFYCPFSAF
jgi:hypothetical protein